MKRNMDLVRDILLHIEEKVTDFGEGIDVVMFDDYLVADTVYHIKLLIEARLVDGRFELNDGADSVFTLNGLTWSGHDFLDAIRDPDVWARTKAGAEQVRSWSFDTLKDLAKGLVKKQLEELTGVKMG